MTHTVSLQRSPLHAWHQARCDNWYLLGDTSLPRHFTDPELELAASADLAACDLSGSPLVELKGAGAAAWLAGHRWPVPATIYEVAEIANRAWILRTGRDEFIVRGVPGTTMAQLADDLPPAGFHDSILTSHRQDALVLLAGSRIVELMSQTCGLDFDRLETQHIFLTRVATASCGLMKDQRADCPACWLWIDPSYSLGWWVQLAQIVDDLGGQVVGAGCFYPE